MPQGAFFMESHDEIRLRVFALTAEPFSGWALDRGMNGFPMSFSEECRLGWEATSSPRVREFPCGQGNPGVSGLV
jgi:hypothetical protein